MGHRRKISVALAAGLWAAIAQAGTAAEPADGPVDSSVAAPHRAARWINPGENGGLAADGSYANDLGQVGVHNARGAVDVSGEPFFAILGSNGRACVSCHQPQDGMSLSLDSIRQQWRVTQGRDPLFANVDGANCPGLDPADAGSHSLLLQRGLFRVGLPWPPRDSHGRPRPTEFRLEVVRDPTGCNADPRYGLGAPVPSVSVYRRPRAAANTAYATAPGLHLMSDARAPTLAAQAADAAAGHLERAAPLSAAQLQGILGFEQQVYVAQRIDRSAGLLESADEAFWGPAALRRAASRPRARGPAVFALAPGWADGSTATDAAGPARSLARAAIARGLALFLAPRIAGVVPGARVACASCHDSPMTGMDATHGWSDAGRTQAHAPAEDGVLPVYRLTCERQLPPPYGGRVLYTSDPGRALITGRCRDIGAFVPQSLRGLAARPPYFVDGSAATLAALVDAYDRQYQLGYTAAEKQDLVHFLGAL